MIGKWLGLNRKSVGRTLAFSFGPSAAWTPSSYASFAREGFAKNPVAHRCVRLVAEAAASCPLLVQGKGVAADRARELLSRPNPDQSRVDLFESFFGYLNVAGNAYLELTGGVDGPYGLYALRPDRMRVMTGPKGWVDGWEYWSGSTTQVYTKDCASGRSAILHMKLFNPADDHYGLSAMEAAARAIDVHTAGGTWAKALLDNATRPSGALVVSGQDGQARLSPDQFERLKDELERLYSGPQNAGRPLLLEGGLDWKPMGHSPAEMDFIQARREAAREIALAFGVPPMILGLPGDNTYSNYKEANLALYRQTILPLVRKTSTALEHFLSPWLGDGLSIKPDEDGLPALSDERALKWRRVDEASFLTEGEKRDALGLEARS
jgi:HK97 family phage portal protein